MENNVLVSVIMPAYNASQYIGEAIESVLAQTYTDWELIIVDDGSIDTTSQIVKEYLSTDKRISYFYQENGKQGKARNLAIAKAKGEYLAFLDADDLWVSSKLETQLIEIQKRKVDLVFSNSYIIENSFSREESKKMHIHGDVYYSKDDLDSFLGGNKIPILTVLVKKVKVLNVSGFSESQAIQNAEDYHLWLKLLMTDCKFYSLGSILAKYRVHDNSATANDRESLDILPAVFFDLVIHYPEFKHLIKDKIKQKFRKIYYTNIFSKNELSTQIQKNTQYLSMTKWNFLFIFLNMLLPTKLTKRILIYTLNG